MSAGETIGPNRRAFLAQVGGAAAAAGVTNIFPGITTSALAHGKDDRDHDSDARRRADEALRVRQRAAQFQRQQELVEHRTNGDERRYANLAGSFGKALPHDGNGEIDRHAFRALVHAMSTGDPADFEVIPLGGTAKLVNPQAAFAFGFIGADTQASGLRRAPAVGSAETAGEMVELYWAALTRDVPFDQFGSNPTIAAAAADLSSLSDFRGPKVSGVVTPDTIFRGPTAGDRIGPYISQLLWKPINYGPYVVDQRVRVAAPGVEYMTDFDALVNILNGGAPVAQDFVGTVRRYVITGRDLAEWVHRDFTHQGGTDAVFILLGSGVGLAAGNPYLTSATQAGFATFGAPQILDVVAFVANLSLQACWFHKWSVHRRVRPEEYGGHVRNRLVLGRQNPVHADLLNSAGLARVINRFGSPLLPMAYPEGCPVHPAYPAGHSSFAGAWATVLKAFFNTSAVIQNPVVPTADGSALAPYSGPALTAGNEIDKLASNISMGRVTSGVHWRSDCEVGMLLGERCAIMVLQDLRRSFNESFVGFRVRKFDGTTVTI